MVRRSEWVQLPNGGAALVTFDAKHLCVRCRRRATIQCDYPIGGGKTCDAYLCRRCAIPQTGKRDYCPHHVPPEAA